jgi:hypothetical protein
MKRLLGALLGLAGLSGCVTFPSEPNLGDLRTPEQPTVRATVQGSSTAPGTTAAASNSGPETAKISARMSGPSINSAGDPFGDGDTEQPPRPTVRPANESSASSRAESVEPPTAHTQSKKPPAPVTPAAAPVRTSGVTGETPSGKGNTPLVRLINTRQITLNFEVKDVGPAGLSGVELWYTKDSKEWKRYNKMTQAPASTIEVDEEGMYGFTLLARSGLGVAKDPPGPGDPPQIWVIVDLTKPEVELTEVSPSTVPRSQQVTIAWTSADKNLGHQPVTLSYAEKEEGPWKVIATNLASSGKYVWQAPTNTVRFLVRVEATDLAGNTGRVLSKPLLLDTSTPTVSIINVEPAPTR